MHRSNLFRIMAVGLIAAAALAHPTTARASEPVYVALSKDFRSEIPVKLLKVYSSKVLPDPLYPPRQMVKMTAVLQLPLYPHQCDEWQIPGKFVTTWTIYLRVGPSATGAAFIPFGTHAGSFTWTDSIGNVIKGSMRGTIACGTHRAPWDIDPATGLGCEDCREPFHFEGFLTGTFASGPWRDMYVNKLLAAPTVQASYAGRLYGQWPTAINGTNYMGIAGAIDGVYSFPSF